MPFYAFRLGNGATCNWGLMALAIVVVPWCLSNSVLGLLANLTPWVLSLVLQRASDSKWKFSSGRGWTNFPWFLCEQIVCHWAILVQELFVQTHCTRSASTQTRCPRLDIIGRVFCWGLVEQCVANSRNSCHFPKLSGHMKTVFGVWYITHVFTICKNGLSLKPSAFLATHWGEVKLFCVN